MKVRLDFIDSTWYGKVIEVDENCIYKINGQSAMNVLFEQERGLKSCGAGLESDFEWTAGMILVDGKPYTDDYTYLASTWATPQLIIYGENDNEGIFDYEETVDCFIMESQTEYTSSSKFPSHLIKEFKQESK